MTPPPVPAQIPGADGRVGDGVKRFVEGCVSLVTALVAKAWTFAVLMAVLNVLGVWFAGVYSGLLGVEGHARVQGWLYGAIAVVAVGSLAAVFRTRINEREAARREAVHDAARAGELDTAKKEARADVVALEEARILQERRLRNYLQNLTTALGVFCRTRDCPIAQASSPHGWPCFTQWPPLAKARLAS